MAPPSTAASACYEERLVITLVLGGARSGKSELAERVAAEAAGAVAYLATATITDDDLGRRIQRHRARRPSTWATLEAGADLVGALGAVAPGTTALVDSLGAWVAHHDSFAVDADALVDAFLAHRGDVVVVSDEVGLGVHPSTEVGRAFRDALGELNRTVAAVADDVLLVIAGRVLPLERR